MQPWTHTGDGATTTFPLPGLPNTRRQDYWVSVGGVRQLPDAYELFADTETVTFAAPPPALVEIVIHRSIAS